MSNAAEMSHHSTKNVKQKLNDIFGKFDDFSQIITTPGIRRSYIHGVVPHPITPLIENSFSDRSPFEEYVEEERHPISANDQPGPSTVTGVLESMKGMVEQSPMSHLGTPPPYFVEPTQPINKASSDRKRKDGNEKHRDSPKKRKVDSRSGTPPGRRINKEVNMRDLFGTTSDDDEAPSKDTLKQKLFEREIKKFEQVAKPKEEEKNKKNKDAYEKIEMKAAVRMQASDDQVSHIMINNSPDSGISSMGGSTIETKDEPPWPVERILGELSHVKPLLSPLHRTELPTPDEIPPTKPTREETIQCKLDLSILPITDRKKLIERWRKANQDNHKPNMPVEKREPQSIVKEVVQRLPKEERISEKPRTDVPPSKETPKKVEKVQAPAKPAERVNESIVKTERPFDKAPMAEPKNPKTIHQGIATIIKATDTAKKSEPIVPISKEPIETPPSRSNSFQYYQSQARALKHKGDHEPDRVEKAMYYLESVVFFIMSIYVHNHRDVDISQYSILSETSNFLNAFLNSRSDFSSYSSIRNRIKILGTLTHACLNYRMYDLRSDQAIKNYDILHKYEKDNPPTQTSAGQKPALGSNNATPSPASSTHSSNHSSGPSPKDKISIPVQIYNIQSNQMKLMNHLFFAHKLWKDAFAAIPRENKDYMNKLVDLCGEPRLDSDMKQLSEYLLTGIRWLRREYLASRSFKR